MDHRLYHQGLNAAKRGWAWWGAKFEATKADEEQRLREGWLVELVGDRLSAVYTPDRDPTPEERAEVLAFAREQASVPLPHHDDPEDDAHRHLGTEPREVRYRDFWRQLVVALEREGTT